MANKAAPKVEDPPNIQQLHDFLMECSNTSGDQFMVAAETLIKQRDKIRNMRSRIGDVKTELGDIMIESHGTEND